MMLLQRVFIYEDDWMTIQFTSEGDKVGFDDWPKYYQLN